MVIDMKLLAKRFNQKEITGEEMLEIINRDMKKDMEDFRKKSDAEEQKHIEKMELKSKKLDEKLEEHYDKGLKRIHEANKNSRNRLLHGLDKHGNKIYKKK
jgi:phage-related protein